MLNSIVLGKRIANLRKSARLSQAELAERLSVSPQAISKWERGESMPDAIMICTLAQGFGVDANTILMPNEAELEEVADSEQATPIVEEPKSERKSAFERAREFASADYDEDEESEEQLQDEESEEQAQDEGMFKGAHFIKRIKREDIKIKTNEEQNEDEDDEGVKVYYKKRGGIYDKDGKKIAFVPLDATNGIDFVGFGASIGDTIDGAFKRAAAGFRVFDKKMKIMNNVFNFQSWNDADFAFVHQPQKSFANCNLKNCTFEGANFTSGSFNAANVKACSFTDANLAKTSFKSASIKGSELRNTNLADAYFAASSLKDCDFEGAVLTGASFRMCSIKEVYFKATAINDVLFSFSSFNTSVFNNGEIRDSVFDQCSFKDVEFEGITFINTALRLCSVRNITFNNCKMDKISYNFFKQLKQIPLDGVELI